MKPIILDIETHALPESEIRASLPPFNPSAVSIPGNYKKQDTIDAYIADAKANYGKDIVEKAALSPVYGRIAIAGMMQGEEILSQGESLLGATWSYLTEHAFKSGRIIGWGIKRFDLPFMIRRSLALGINVPPSIWRPARYGFSDSVIDLEEIWKALCGLAPAQCVSLSSVLTELGLPAKSGDGAEFGKLWEADKAAALEYNAQDLRCEAALAERLGVI